MSNRFISSKLEMHCTLLLNDHIYYIFSMKTDSTKSLEVKTLPEYYKTYIGSLAQCERNKPKELTYVLSNSNGNYLGQSFHKVKK